MSQNITIGSLNTLNGMNAPQAQSELTDTEQKSQETNVKPIATEQAKTTETTEQVISQVPPVPQVQDTCTNTDDSVECCDKHMVTFVGQGIWIDGHGNAWCKTERDNMITTKTFTDDEFNSREDIVFMVRYGAMKDVRI